MSMPETVALPEAPETGISALIQRIWPLSLAAIAITGLIAGGLLRWWHAGLLFWSTTALVSATVIVIVALSVDVALSLRRGDIGLDLIAALSMSAALWFGEYFAGAIVAVMYAGGQFLESFAQRRAESGMSELLSRAPRRAVRITASGLSEVPIAALLPGDRLLVRKGDVVPVDGKVIAGHTLLNESALTGESLPVRRGSGELIMSGSSNLGDAFEMIASGSANESTYAGIVRMVSQARSSKAPISRLADRFSLAFLAMTLVIAGLAAWLSGDPARIVAVLVVATPCPLILAVPVALVAGMSKAARAGVLVKGAHVLEVLATISVVVFDKTGTLTTGEPAVVSIETDRDADELLRLAASVDQASAHVIGQTIVEEAKRRGLKLTKPVQLAEVPGEGIEECRCAQGSRRRVGFHCRKDQVRDPPWPEGQEHSHSLCCNRWNPCRYDCHGGSGSQGCRPGDRGSPTSGRQAAQPRDWRQERSRRRYWSCSSS
jgi:cation transport ATPase